MVCPYAGVRLLSQLPFARLRLEQRPRRFVAIKLTNIAIYIGMNLFWLIFCPLSSQKRHGLGAHAVWSPGLRCTDFLSNLLASMVTLLLLSPQIRMIRWAFDGNYGKRWWDMLHRLSLSVWLELWMKCLAVRCRNTCYPARHRKTWAGGYFGANYKLAALITLFTQAYRYAAEPFFFRHAQEKDALRTQAEVTKWFTISSAAGMLGILLFLIGPNILLDPNIGAGCT